MERWKSSGAYVYNLGHHLIWCPKYRRKVLAGDVEIRLKELIFEKAREIDMEIETMEIILDHVHLFVKTNPPHAPHFVVGQLKGYTSRTLRQEFSKLKSGLPTLWTRSCYTESISHISEATIKKYISRIRRNANA